MILSGTELQAVLSTWYQAWNNHDLKEVMALFHDEVFFCHWSGQQVRGKNQLKRAWRSWFKEHGNFVFKEVDTFIDESQQKAAFHWMLTWPSLEDGFTGKQEVREGVDLLHFRGGKIIHKLSFSKTQIEIDKNRVKLSAK